MCEKCDDSAIDLILDYLLLDIHLEVSVALARDAVTHNVIDRSLNGLSDEEAMADLHHCIGKVNQAADHLRSLTDQDFSDMLVGRQLLKQLL